MYGRSMCSQDIRTVLVNKCLGKCLKEREKVGKVLAGG